METYMNDVEFNAAIESLNNMVVAMHHRCLKKKVDYIKEDELRFSESMRNIMPSVRGSEERFNKVDNIYRNHVLFQTKEELYMYGEIELDEAL